MTKEILIYGDIDQYSAQDFILAMQEAGDDDITIRINTDGGDPEYMWGAIAKLSQHKGKKLILVDGKAYSAGTFILAYADQVECLDVSQFLIHRAAYSSWFEENYMTDELWQNLDTINKNLRKALENKIDIAAFEDETGVKMDEIFSNESRKDVFLTAKQAKKIGLVNKINRITPQQKADITARMATITIKHIPDIKIAAKADKPMTTLEELKAAHPTIYKMALDKGKRLERQRVNAWMAFKDTDAEAVEKGISSGAKVDIAVMANMQAKMFSPEALAKITAANAPPVIAGKKPGEEETVATEKEEKIAAFMDEVDRNLGKKPAVAAK